MTFIIDFFIRAKHNLISGTHITLGLTVVQLNDYYQNVIQLDLQLFLNYYTYLSLIGTVGALFILYK